MTAVLFENTRPVYVKITDFEELIDKHLHHTAFDVELGAPPPARQPYFFTAPKAASLRSCEELIAVVESSLYEEYEGKLELRRKDLWNQKVMRRFKKIGERERRFSV